MGLLGRAPRLRAVAFAWGLAWLAPTTDLVAATPDSFKPFEGAVRSAEPFGLSVEALPGGALQNRWHGLARKLDDDGVQIALCDSDRERCACDPAVAIYNHSLRNGCEGVVR